MTQMADEIRALIADLYDDPEDFLKAPHQWFGGRSPDELMATEAGQFVLLKFLRGRNHMPPIEPDRDFKPYTAGNIDYAIDQVIARLEGQIEQRPLRQASRGIEFWRLIPLSRSTTWIWLSLTHKPIHCRVGIAKLHHGQAQLP